jgi:hypothetical protein
MCPLIIITEILSCNVLWHLVTDTCQVLLKYVYPFPIPVKTLLQWAVIPVFKVFKVSISCEPRFSKFWFLFHCWTPSSSITSLPKLGSSGHKSIYHINPVLSFIISHSTKLIFIIYHNILLKVQWLRHCATNREVTGSIPDSVLRIFHWHNPFSHTMALGSTQPLTEMSTRDISWG